MMTKVHAIIAPDELSPCVLLVLFPKFVNLLSEQDHTRAAG